MAILKTNSYDGRYMCFDCSSEVTGPGKTKITWELYAKGGNSTYYYVGPITAKINGKEVYTFDGRGQQATGRKASGSFTVTHGTDGVGKYTWSIRAAIYSTSVNCTGSGTYTLASKNYPYTANGNPSNVKLAFNGKSATAAGNDTSSFVYAVSADTVNNWKTKTGGNDTVTLTWSAPTLGTNNSVENYIVQYYDDYNSGWVNWKTTTAKSVTFKLSELSGDILDHYQDRGHLFFQITANNKYDKNTSSYNVGLKAKTYWSAPNYTFKYSITYNDYSNNGETATKTDGFTDLHALVTVPSSNTKIWQSNIQLTLTSVTFAEGTPSKIIIKESGATIELNTPFNLNNTAISLNTLSIYGDDGFGGDTKSTTFDPHTPEQVNQTSPTFDAETGTWNFSTNSQQVRSSVLVNPSNYEIAKNTDSSNSISLINDINLDKIVNLSGTQNLKIRSIFYDGTIWSNPRDVAFETVWITNYNQLVFDTGSRATASTPECSSQYELALIFTPLNNVATITKYTTGTNTKQITMTLTKSISSLGYVTGADSTYKTNIPGSLLLQWVHRNTEANKTIIDINEGSVVATNKRLTINYTKPQQVFSGTLSNTIDIFQNSATALNNFHAGFNIGVFTDLSQNNFVNKIGLKYNGISQTYTKQPIYINESNVGYITVPGFTYNDLFQSTLNIPLFNSNLLLDLTIYYDDGGIEEPHTITLTCSSVPYYTIDSLSLSSYGVFDKSFLIFSAGNLVDYSNKIKLTISNPSFNNTTLIFQQPADPYSLAYKTNSFTYNITNDFEYITNNTTLDQLVVDDTRIILGTNQFSRIAFSAQIPTIMSAQVINSENIQINLQNEDFGASTALVGADKVISGKVNNEPRAGITLSGATITIPVDPTEDEGKTVFNISLTLTNTYNGKSAEANIEYTVFDIAPPLSLRKNVVGINTKTVESQVYKDACLVVTSTSGRNQIIFNGGDDTKITIDLSNGSISGATLDGGTWT